MNINHMDQEEHDFDLNAKKVSLISSPTIYAVVNTSAPGVSNSIVTVANTVSISSPTIYAVVNTSAPGISNSIVTVANTVPVTFSGNVTLDAGSKTGIAGNVTLTDSKGFIGLVSVSGFANPMPVSGTFWQATQPVSFSGNVTLDPGSKTQIIGNVTLSDSKTFIGLTTTTLGASPAFVGLVTVANTVTVGAHGLTGTVTIQDGGNSITIDGNVGITGNVTITDSKGFIGLVTAWSRNAGTSKTLINLPVTLSTSSIATIAVATGGNAIFYITQNLISSDATVRVSIKSGPTYLTGNASIGVTLNPGGGWVENGGVDAPNYIGLASGAAIVVEKFDMTATKANIGGKIMYFSE